MPVFDKITSTGVVFMIVHRRCTGSLVSNILRRGAMNKFYPDVDWVPLGYSNSQVRVYL